MLLHEIYKVLNLFDDVKRLDTKSGYQNFNTMKEAEAKKKAVFCTLGPFEPTFSSECHFTFVT